MNTCAPCQPPTEPHLLTLNRDCACLPLPRSTINAGLAASPLTATVEPLLRQRLHLFAATSVFVSPQELAAMERQIQAIESLARLPPYREAIYEREPWLADSGQVNTRGLFMGYDFHLTEAGPRLIEVNTNAGGAFVMHALLTALQTHVSAVPQNQPGSSPAELERCILAMFQQEWQRAGRSGWPAVVAIVDEKPTEQYLYPDMLLAQQMLERHGIQAHIIDPAEMHIEQGRLQYQHTTIDMVYNRLTDFALTSPANQTLRQALAQNLAVISPAPRQHALLADKRNLALWQDTQMLGEWGLADEQQQVLNALPAAEPVTSESADALWQARKGLFFKPNAGFGGRAAYRGGKLTRRVWQEIATGGYVAQSFVPPAERNVGDGAASALMKFDVRLYTYAGQTLLTAARIYQGQTTNFRTPGGGFAPVVVGAGC